MYFLRPALCSLLFVSLLSSFGSINAHAATITWTNTGGGNWSTSGNWNSGAGPVPGSGDDVLITTDGTYTVTLDVDPTLASLTLGAASGTQTLSSSSHVLILNGASTVKANGVLMLVHSVINGSGALDNQGLVMGRGDSDISVALTTAVGSTLRSEGAVGVGAATLRVQNGFTNNGTIELTNNDPGQAATFQVTNGTLTNAAGRAINVLANGGARTLRAQLDNFGTLTVGQSLVMDRGTSTHVNEASGTIDVSGGDLTVAQVAPKQFFTHNGTLTIGPGRTLSINAAEYFHNSSLGGSGAIVLNNSLSTLGVNLTDANDTVTITGGIVNGAGTLVNTTGRTMLLTQTTVNAPTTIQGTLVARGFTTDLFGAVTTAVGSTLRVEGTAVEGAAHLRVGSGFTNNGTIELTNNAPGQAATLEVLAGTLTNAAGRAINVLANGGGRTLAAQLDNFGTLSVGQALVIDRGSSAHVNEAGGTIDVSGGDLTLAQGGTNPSLTNNGILTIGAGRTLTINGGTYANNASPVGTGALAWNNMTAALAVNMNVPNGGLTMRDCVVNGPGQLVNAAGRTVITILSTLNAATTNHGTMVFWGKHSSMTGALTMAVGSTLRVEGDAVWGEGKLFVANGFTNNGTIELTNTVPGQPSWLIVTNGTLTNAAGHAINVLGNGGFRLLTAQLDNFGTLSVGQTLGLDRGSSAHVNEPGGTIDVSGGDLTLTQGGTNPSFTNHGTLTIGSGRMATVSSGTMSNAVDGVIRGTGNLNVAGTAFTNSGIVSPGASAGILTITGDDPEVAGGNLNIELGGTTPGTGYDRLVVTGVLKRASTLNISVINGFVPAAGDQFRVLEFGSTTGDFEKITGRDLGGNLSLDPRYDATGLTLVVVSQIWRKVDPTNTPPSGRDSHTAVYDAANNRMIVFGGRGDSGPLNDTRVLTNANGLGGASTWSTLSPTGGPPAARGNHTAVYDPGTNRMIVYAGDDVTGGSPAMFNDVWVLTNANGLGGAPAWSALATAGGPPPTRTQHSAVYDPASNRMTVFGGNPTAGSCASGLSDVWVLTNANGLGGTPTWSSLATSGGPPSARRSHNASYDAANNLMVVFGGDLSCVTSSNEVWTLSHPNGLGGGAVWTLLSTSGPVPSPWSLHSAVYDSGLNRLTAFGGLISGTPSSQVLNLGGANGMGGPAAWIDYSFTGFYPAPRSLHSAVQDNTNHRMVMFAGLTGYGRESDVWVLEETQGRPVDVPPVISPVSPTSTGFSRPLVPNPSRGMTTFAIAIDRPQNADVSIHDLAGRRVATLHHGALEAGEHAFGWNGVLSGGRRVAPGIYLVHFRGERVSESRRICVIP